MADLLESRSHPRRRPPGRAVALLGCLALVAGLGVTAGPAPAAAAAAAPGPACPEVMPVSEVAPGMEGTGLTVARGSVPEPFSVKVIDVLRDGIAPGVDLIVVEADSPAIRQAGGVWAGMSGSPVSIGGRLVGALSYGFSAGPSRQAGLTPAAHLLGLVGGTGPEAGGGRRAAGGGAGGAPPGRAADRGMAPLPLPLAVSGLGRQRMDEVNAGLARAGVRAFAHGGGGRAGGGRAASAATGVAPGDNFGAALSFGDVTAAAVGTTSVVCHGAAVAFGHPLLRFGRTRMSAHAADAVAVISDPTLGPYKLVNLGAVVGTVDEDRLVGLRATLGPAPATAPVTSTAVDADDGRTRQGRTDAVLPDLLPAIAALHVVSNLDALVDDVNFAGTAELRWTVRGGRGDGRPWSLSRANRFADEHDLVVASVAELARDLVVLQGNELEAVDITGVDVHVRVSSPMRRYQVVERGITVSTDGVRWTPVDQGVRVAPGGAVHVRVPLRAYRAPAPPPVEVVLEVPADASGPGFLEVAAGTSPDDPFACMFDDSACGPEADPSVDSFDALLASLGAEPRNDHLVAALRLDDPAGASRVVASARVRLDQVVRGRGGGPVEVEGQAGGPGPG